MNNGIKNRRNPFGLLRASEFSQKQINDYWVSYKNNVVDTILKPHQYQSLYILGGKGTGKTHLLRYYTYSTIRTREMEKSGFQIISEYGFLSVFLRSNTFDSLRYSAIFNSEQQAQLVFARYIELRLVELVLECLIDIIQTSENTVFNELGFIEEIKAGISFLEQSIEINSIVDLKNWLTAERNHIDLEIDKAAFSGKIEIREPIFTIGQLFARLKSSLLILNRAFENISLLYFIDEIEVFTYDQQIVLNSLIRNIETNGVFRLAGRLYGRHTFSTLSGEENREGSEFVTILLDPFLYMLKSKQFYIEFIHKRLSLFKELPDKYNISSKLESIDTSEFYDKALKQMNITQANDVAEKIKSNFIRTISKSAQDMDNIYNILTVDFNILLGKINLLRFYKKFKKNKNPLEIASIIRGECLEFKISPKRRNGYSTFYNHYSLTVFNQICKLANKPIPYSGLDKIINITNGNPRNILVIMDKIYNFYNLEGEDIYDPSIPISIKIQTDAILEAANFILVQDSNYGIKSDLARKAVFNIGEVLEVATYSERVPEVEPLAFTLSYNCLNEEAKKALRYAVNYSFIIESEAGRIDRNTAISIDKYYLNPMLSAKWGLGVGVRGDITLSTEIANAIFDITDRTIFMFVKKNLGKRWGELTQSKINELSAGSQGTLFKND